MRHAFAHEAVLAMDHDADLRAPGGAVTVALCGHWEHEPPCPLAPHHTAAERVDGEVRIRTLFVVEPDQEAAVRERIDAGLGAGTLTGPDGTTTHWRLRSSAPSEVRTSEADHTQRLLRA
jgi:hypothetical protein